MKEEIKTEEYKKIVERVIDLGRESAILSSRGWDVKKQDNELSELYSKNPDAYTEGYKEVKKSFGH